MKNSLNLAILLVFVLLLSGCVGRRGRTWPLEQMPTGPSDYTVYFLPQNVVQLQFTLLRHRHTAGPYAAYQGQLLGVEPASTPVVRYAIGAVQLRTRVAPDLAHPIAARVPRNCPLFLRMLKGGYLVPANADRQPSEAANLPDGERESQPLFVDLSVQPFIDDQRNIFYSVVEQDSALVRVPVQRTVTVQRTLQEKAKQAADLIFSLRKKRIDLISGEVDLSNSPGTLPVMLAEIARLEEAYLSLFIGRDVTDTLRVDYEVTPQPGQTITIPCRFSPERGVVPASEFGAKPITLSITPGAQSDSAAHHLRPVAGRFYYRVAAPVEYTLSLEGQHLLQGQLYLAQFGRVMTLPLATSRLGRCK